MTALLACPSVAAAARHCGLAEKTLWRYLADSPFRAELQRRRDAVLSASTTGLVAAGQDATTALSELLGDPGTPASVRARVAQAILELARKGIEADDLLTRVERLEQALQNTEV